MSIPANETQAQRQARWQIEEDAQTLRMYTDLVGNPIRLQNAKNKLIQDAAQLQEAIEAAHPPS